MKEEERDETNRKRELKEAKNGPKRWVKAENFESTLGEGMKS